LARLDYRIKYGPAQCTDGSSRYSGTVRGTARRPHLSLVVYVNGGYFLVVWV
jgi:hypothetical protein